MKTPGRGGGARKNIKNSKKKKKKNRPTHEMRSTDRKKLEMV